MSIGAGHSKVSEISSSRKRAERTGPARRDVSPLLRFVLSWKYQLAEDTVSVERFFQKATLRPWSLGRQPSPSAQRFIRFIWHRKVVYRRYIDADIRLCPLIVRNFDPLRASYTRSSRPSSIGSLLSNSTRPSIRSAS
ncbi:glycogenin-2 [Pseudozyma hubeiensis SY62]|uniref:Glycogenin-2 n=1 Tax=Pseudozyma hubeiensis (strain SY62) TaxID=1305764 RepID=R9PES2_PSEHS|nr:glycogenin-2 [Pseudozyma hubeiensis SY62]GAC99868.1 glycogenin-2 [Pseudozyma hubeiensis SY62]